MEYPAVGDKVKAVEVPEYNEVYLTAGKVYEVTRGDRGSWAFNIIADTGVELFCLFPSCAHATWEFSE